MEVTDIQIGCEIEKGNKVDELKYTESRLIITAGIAKY